MKKNNTLLIISIILLNTSIHVFGLSYSRSQHNPGFLFKARTQYTQQKMREYNVQEKIKELESQGKTPDEIRREFIVINTKTPESKTTTVYSHKLRETEREAPNFREIEQEFVKAFKKEKATPEYRVAYPERAPKTNPTIWAPKTRQTSTISIPQPQQPSEGLWDSFVDWLRK